MKTSDTSVVPHWTSRNIVEIHLDIKQVNPSCMEQSLISIVKSCPITAPELFSLNVMTV